MCAIIKKQMTHLTSNETRSHAVGSAEGAGVGVVSSPLAAFPAAAEVKEHFRQEILFICTR